MKKLVNKEILLLLLFISSCSTNLVDKTVFEKRFLNKYSVDKIVNEDSVLTIYSDRRYTEKEFEFLVEFLLNAKKGIKEVLQKNSYGQIVKVKKGLLERKYIYE